MAAGQARAARYSIMLMKVAPPLPRATELLSPRLRDLFFRQGTGGNALWIPSRYKVPYGGRGGSKTWGTAGVAVTLGAMKPMRFLCTREYQSSVKESVHQILSSRIIDLGLSPYYEIMHDSIRGKIRDDDGRRTEFIFAGIKTDPAKVKGTEDIDVCLVEEAEKVSSESWKELTPTVRNRRGGSEIWVVYNPGSIDAPTHQKFVINPNHDPRIMRVVKVNYYDNPWFPQDLELERQDALRQIREAREPEDRARFQQDYDHVWEGECQVYSEAQVFRGKWVVESFEPHTTWSGPYFGGDWGFSQDPTTLVKMWVHEDTLYVEREAYAIGCDIDKTPALFLQIPGAEREIIRADNARPETISYLQRHGFPRMVGCEKWKGSVEDGVAHLRSYRKIVLHTRCKHAQQEMRLYSYKVDKRTNNVMADIEDKNNHIVDAMRYGIEPLIKRRQSYFGRA